MIYFFVVCLGFLLCGCEGCGPDCTCPETENETFVTSVIGSPDGGAVITGWEYNHQVTDDPTPLDCSCAYDFASPSVIILDASGGISKRFSGVAFFEAGMYVGDQLTLAGFANTECGREYGWTPYIETRNAEMEIVRHAMIECELFANLNSPFYDNVPRIQASVTPLTDETFLFHGIAPDSTYKMLKISVYGEVLWEHTLDEPFGNSFALPNGEFAFVWPDYAELYNGVGYSVQVFGFGQAPDMYVYSMAEREDGTFIIAGNAVGEHAQTDIRLFAYAADGTQDTVITIPWPGCQDSVTVATGNYDNELILACRQRDDCGDDVGLLVLRVSEVGEVLASQTIGSPNTTVLRGLDLPEAGNIFVAATTNALREDRNYYGKVVKFNSALTKLWEQSFGP